MSQFVVFPYNLTIHRSRLDILKEEVMFQFLVMKKTLT